MTIKAIETVYNGYRFRSRLEARWAVFFDALGIKYEYEKEGYDLGEDGWYLPDFWLPDLQKFVEIKGHLPLVDDEQRKAIAFNLALKETDQMYFILVGNPYIHKDLTSEYSVFSAYEKVEQKQNEWFVHCPLCNNVDISYYNGPFGDNTDACYCWYCDGVNRDWRETETTLFHKGFVESKNTKHFLLSPKLTNAYTKARQARFEHGECG